MKQIIRVNVGAIQAMHYFTLGMLRDLFDKITPWQPDTGGRPIDVIVVFPECVWAETPRSIRSI